MPYKAMAGELPRKLPKDVCHFGAGRGDDTNGLLCARGS